MVHPQPGSNEAVAEAVRQARSSNQEDSFAHYKGELNRYSSDIQTALRDRPLTVLGVAIVAGFALGAVWKA